MARSSDILVGLGVADAAPVPQAPSRRAMVAATAAAAAARVVVIMPVTVHEEDTWH